MNKNKKTLKVVQIVCLLAATLFMLIQMYSLKGIAARAHYSFVRFMPNMLHNATIMIVPMVFGAVYSKKKQSVSESFKYWLMAIVTLIVYYILFFIKVPGRFNMWRVFGMLFPIITSTSVLFAGLFFSMLVQPRLYDLQHKLTEKQNLLVLSILTLLGFALSAGNLTFQYSLYGLYLILFFAWGMFLANVEIKGKVLVLALLSGLVSFFVVVIGVSGFDAVYWSQIISGNGGGDWNREFLNNPSSPFMFLLVVAAFLLFKKVIMTFSEKQMRYFIPVIMLMDAPISNRFMNAFRFTGSSMINKLIMIVLMVIIAIIWDQLLERYLFKLKPCAKVIDYLNHESSLAKICEKGWQIFTRFIIRNRVNLLTWAWFYILSFGSFLIESDNLRIQISTAATINAIVYLLGTKFFAIILTTIFLDALFSIFYFITTRYWTSNMLVSLIAIGWAIANKIKLLLRGEPIYPTEISEIVNWKTLLPMVGKKLVIVILIAIVIVIALDVFLELKFTIKKHGSWKKRGIWALISLLLFMTPLRFNHDGGVIYHINRGFDNRQKFRNPERDIQVNGPVLNFLNYIDLQIMDQPATGYSASTIKQLNDKYSKVANRINKNRKNDLQKQTIVFNLSESFVDPNTFPTIKFERSAPNPVKFIESMKSRSSYGTMLSAGYGGGTANMEWETLTGLNMGLFKSTLTPYVQVVPNYDFYPTIGMNFDYKSAVHPFIGTYYSRREDYRRFKFDKFVYAGSKYKIIDQKKLGKSGYNSDFTTYANGLHQINSRKGGQFINLISIQNHMPYNNWYPHNEYMGKISGDLFNTPAVREQMATYVKGTQYTDKAVKQFIGQIDKIKKPITLVFYGDHYPSIISQSYTAKYPVQMHSTRYFIYSNKYAREHGAKTRLPRKANNFVSSSDFIAMMLEQTDSKVTPYQALLTEVHKKLPAITINFDGDKGYELIGRKGQVIDPKYLTKKQQELLSDYETIQYDMTAGKAYGLGIKGFYK
ncbi:MULTISPECIES: alkaline phosphatase family protein [Lactobacillus]|uniref:Sulfatase-like hydrolase/transferase n=1 Tax=Lactobacillus panisapium TaxID=2012495 RepID=A0ABX8WCK0_9LACO|nr:MULTISPECIES: alkaline phosphatase family protein [Lactobacillus]MCO6533415.1 sulfatase-like hydrolase/transferase [Lactobacillus sp.]QYN53507.1 sulfatase-like hydrolase/transferase [Lactobacillus panisapium]QYN59255.1 sulfatase-like hydrolase/transferase [Lactobacillus panisapium]